MKTKKILSFLILFLSLTAFVLLPLGSWIFSAFGFPCNSLYSSNGMRWVFSNALDVWFNDFAKWLLLCAFLYEIVASYGLTWQDLGRNPKTSMICSFFTLVAIFAYFYIIFFQNDSLLDINGQILEDVWKQGIPFFLVCLFFMMITAYAYILGKFSHTDQIRARLSTHTTRFLFYFPRCSVLSYIT